MNSFDLKAECEITIKIKPGGTASASFSGNGIGFLVAIPSFIEKTKESLPFMSDSLIRKLVENGLKGCTDEDIEQRRKQEKLKKNLDSDLFPKQADELDDYLQEALRKLGFGK